MGSLTEGRYAVEVRYTDSAPTEFRQKFRNDAIELYRRLSDAALNPSTTGVHVYLWDDAGFDDKTLLARTENFTKESYQA